MHSVIQNILADVPSEGHVSLTLQVVFWKMKRWACIPPDGFHFLLTTVHVMSAAIALLWLSTTQSFAYCPLPGGMGERIMGEKKRRWKSCVERNLFPNVEKRTEVMDAHTHTHTHTHTYIYECM